MHATKMNKQTNTTAAAQATHCRLRRSASLLFIALYRDKAERPEEWPEIKARCIQGPFLTPEGLEILFDPTQRTSVCQVKPAHCSMGTKACAPVTMEKKSLTVNRAIFVHSVDLNYMHPCCCN